MNHTLTAPVAGVTAERTDHEAPPRPARRARRARLRRLGHRAERDPIRLSHERRVDPGRHALLRRPPQRDDRALGAVPDRARRRSPRSSARSSRGSSAEPGRAAALRRGIRGGGDRRYFTIVTSADVAIAAYIHRGAADPSVVEGLWVLHNSVFGFLVAAIGIALAGLTTGRRQAVCCRSGGPSPVPSARALMVAGADDHPAIVDGSPTFFVGVAGFAVWLAFVIRTAVALLRSRDI